MTENTITIDTIVDTQYGEKAILRSPFDAKDHIKSLPWNGEEESFEETSRDAEGNTLLEPDEIQSLEDEFGVPEFAAFPGWDNGRGVWMIDADAIEETAAFLETLGWEVEVKVSQQLEA